MIVSHNEIPGKFHLNGYVDITNYSKWVYVLNENHLIQICQVDEKYITTIKLIYTQSHPVCIHVDDRALYVGFIDGRIEIREKLAPYNLIKITSDKDAGGPGEKQILLLYSSNKYLMANTKENGLLIYHKDDFVFYKWIMIGGYTSIICFDIFDEYLFVVAEDYQIHLLNFNISKLIPLGFRTDEYIDISFDGKYLYLATDEIIRVFDIKGKHKILWDYSQQHSNIAQIASLDSKLVVLLENKEIIEINKINFNLSETDLRDISPYLFTKMKNNYLCNKIQNENQGSFFEVAWVQNKSIWLSTISF